MIQDSLIKSALRKIWLQSTARTEAIRLSKVERNAYRCAICKGIFTHKEIQCDHIEPVVPITGFTTWDDYISRLFIGVEGLQVLCRSDHAIKTQKENIERKKINDATKLTLIKQENNKNK